jgi:hypothetical protein
MINILLFLALLPLALPGIFMILALLLLAGCAIEAIFDWLRSLRRP